jgi:hypothetical protein
MVAQPPIKGAFDKRAEVDFQRRFTSPETRTAAREVQGRAGILIERAKAYRDERLKNIVKVTQEKPQPRLTPRFIGRLFGQARTAQRHDFSREQDRLQRRSDRILKARDNELQRIEGRQAGEGKNPPVEAGYLAGQFHPPDQQEAAHEAPEQEHEPAPAEAEAVESTPSWTPEEREAAINAVAPVRLPPVGMLAGFLIGPPMRHQHLQLVNVFQPDPLPLPIRPAP